MATPEETKQMNFPEFPARVGQQGHPAEGLWDYAYCSSELTEETEVTAQFESEEPSELEICWKVFHDDIFQLIVT